MMKIATIKTIPIYIHWSFWILFALILYFFGIYPIFVISFSILVHELGHAAMATRFNKNVEKIALTGFGGYTLIENKKIPKPKEEILIALAGPLANIALCFVAMPFLFLKSAIFFTLTLYFIATNAIVGIANLVPTYPLDGAHVFRGLLRIKYNELFATKVVSIFGIVITFFWAFFTATYSNHSILVEFFWCIIFFELNIREYKYIRDYYINVELILNRMRKL